MDGFSYISGGSKPRRPLTCPVTPNTRADLLKPWSMLVAVNGQWWASCALVVPWLPGCARPALGRWHHEMPAAEPATDKALFPQHRQRPLGRALRHPVLLCERLHRRDAPLQFPRLNLAAKNSRELEIKRLFGVVVDAHKITLGNPHVHRPPQVSAYVPLWTLVELGRNVASPRTTERDRQAR
jgi:hypothetical protein